MARDNKARLLDLAVDAIDHGGEASLRISDILAEAGVTTPVLYHYFGSREGLVIAAQIERYTRQTCSDVAAIERGVGACKSGDDLRSALIVTWQRSLAQRAENRWRRTSVVGSAYARPELEAAITRAQDEIVAELVSIFEPCRERGWLCPGIDLTSTVAWHHSVLISRVFIERGMLEVDSHEWDRLTLDSLERAFFGP